MLSCYFIAQSGSGVEHLRYRTVDDEPLGFVCHQDLVAAVRRFPSGTRFTPELMLEYNAVLATACRRATVLPLRFGAGFRGESAVARLLAERRRELRAALERLDAKVEMGLRIRLAHGESARDKAAELAAVGKPADAWVEVCSNPAGETVLEAAHLIERRDVADYRQRLKGWQVQISGPRPPLHFLPRFLRLSVSAERAPGRSAGKRKAH